MRIEQRHANVLFVHLEEVREGWEQWFLLSSDRHHDNAHCNRELEIEHLEEVRKRNAGVLDFGDLFCAMQGRYDPRRSYPDMRPEYFKQLNQGRSYLDLIVQEAAEFYKPYASHLILLARGNHETSIARHTDTDLTNRLVGALNRDAGTCVYSGGYGGWVCFMFTIQGTQRERINLKYFHGAGTGNAAVTKGMIQANRQSVILPDAQIIVNGHIHESWIMAQQRERLTRTGVIYQDTQYHVRTGTYKDEYLDGSGGWHVEGGKGPKPKGAVWLRFYFERGHIRIQLNQDVR